MKLDPFIWNTHAIEGVHRANEAISYIPIRQMGANALATLTGTACLLKRLGLTIGYTVAGVAGGLLLRCASIKWVSQNTPSRSAVAETYVKTFYTVRTLFISFDSLFVSPFSPMMSRLNVALQHQCGLIHSEKISREEKAFKESLKQIRKDSEEFERTCRQLSPELLNDWAERDLEPFLDYFKRHEKFLNTSELKEAIGALEDFRKVIAKAQALLAPWKTWLLAEKTFSETLASLRKLISNPNFSIVAFQSLAQQGCKAFDQMCDVNIDTGGNSHPNDPYIEKGIALRDLQRIPVKEVNTPVFARQLRNFHNLLKQ